MEYRDFFKNKKATVKDIEQLLPEGVDPKEFQKGIIAEFKHTEDEFTAAKIASKNLQEDANYYSKIQESIEDEEECVGEGCEEEEECAECIDDNGGLPLMGGALNIPHHGQPIRLGKIIQVGKEFGGPASGELSGMTKTGVTKDRGGVPAIEPGDKEPITAAGKGTNKSSIASKSVGGTVVPGEGQKQGGLNTKGTIASTPRLDENKKQVREIVKEVLKEVRFDENSGKWVKIDEGKHKPGCKCAFCMNKGKFGKKSKTDNEKEDVDESTVDMKMGPSYKVVQPTLAKTSEPDFFARTNQYDPEISEMYDEEEECKMNNRYVELANAQRNLNENELSELKSLREKIDRLEEKKRKKRFLKQAIKKSHKGYCTPMTKPTCTPHRKALAKRLKPGGDLYQKAHGKEEQQETFKKTMEPHFGSDWAEEEEEEGYEEDEGLSLEEIVNMKMGPAYKVVQPTLAKTSEPDFFARTNEYDPEVSEAIGEEGGVEKGHKGQAGFNLWLCRDPKCRQEVTAKEKPEDIKWNDGHVCRFEKIEEESVEEVGGQAVQHSSYRTVGHGNLPQSGKQRWADDLDEAKKRSKVVKTIQKGMKSKTATFAQKLKHQPPKKTTSGVHKRKP
jgi:uncharacterized protein (UPF0335 family)